MTGIQRRSSFRSETSGTDPYRPIGYPDGRDFNRDCLKDHTRLSSTK
jgi:hypothetical protein